MRGKAQRLLWAFAGIATAFLPSPCHAILIKLRCAGGPRYGILSVVMHSGTAGTNVCREFCVMYPLFSSGLTCGRCGNVDTEGIPPGVPTTSSPPPPPPPPPPSPTAGAPPPPPPSPTSGDMPVAAPPNVEPNPNSAFSIAFDLVGIPAGDTEIFTSAAARWSTVITSDLTDGLTNGLRGISGCTYPSSIDDVFICASYVFIDGPRRVLGSAGPFYTRTSSGLPIIGEMRFDTADITSLKAGGGFYDTILHEMGHVIGLGTLWNSRGAAGSSFLGCPYRGRNANREYQAISGCSAVPTEQDGGSGTACGHWDEFCLVNELMTGFLTPGTQGSLSRITVGSLQDLGYTVDYDRADAYTSANLGPGCTCRRRNMMEMFNGETFQLGLRSSTTKRQNGHRRLSNEAHQMAMDTGHSILQERSAAKQQKNSKAAGSRSGNLFDDALGVTYVGDQVVSVLVEDDGEVFGVVVRRDSN